MKLCKAVRAIEAGQEAKATVYDTVGVHLAPTREEIYVCALAAVPAGKFFFAEFAASRWYVVSVMP